MTVRPITLGIALLCVALGVATRTVADVSAPPFPPLEERLEAATKAEEAYRRGVEAPRGSAVAEKAFRESAAHWRTVIDLGADGPTTWYNLGNALLRGDEVGEAIVAYRTAQRLEPGADDVAANLAEARRRVERPIGADANDLSFTDVASWWHLLGPRSRLLLAMAGWITFWILLFLRTGVDESRRRAESESITAAWRGGLVVSLTIGILGGLTIAADLAFAHWRPVGVVTAESAILRSGNGEAFENLTTEPLAEGVEFAIEETRPGWWRVRLPDDTVGWISRQDASAVGETTIATP